MIVLDASALRGLLAGDVAIADALEAAAGEAWLIGPLALADVLATAAADSAASLSRVQHAIAELEVSEVDLTSHAGVILGRLLGECPRLDITCAATLQLAIERDARVATTNEALREACMSRGVTLL